MYKLLEWYIVFFLWKNFWPFLMSGGIQNPLVSIWPSLLGHQPPTLAIFLAFSHSLWRGQADKAGSAESVGGTEPRRAYRKPCEFCKQKARQALLQLLEMQASTAMQPGHGEPFRWQVEDIGWVGSFDTPRIPRLSPGAMLSTHGTSIQGQQLSEL